MGGERKMNSVQKDIKETKNRGLTMITLIVFIIMHIIAFFLSIATGNEALIDAGLVSMIVLITPFALAFVISVLEIIIKMGIEDLTYNPKCALCGKQPNQLIPFYTREKGKTYICPNCLQKYTKKLKEETK